MKTGSRSIRWGFVSAMCGWLLAVPIAVAAGQTFVWWEGEDFADTNVPNPRHVEPPNITDAERAILSGGAWFSPRGPEGDGPWWATYTVEVPESRTYDFYVRKFWRHGPFRWRFGDRDWQVCGRGAALLDETFMRLHWGANWVYLGRVELEAGPHTLTVEMLEPDGGMGCLDAFVLIDGPFLPRGHLRPDQTTGLSEEGWFAWEPPADPLSDESPIDLRYLNEAQAGQSGFVRRQGSGFVLGDGTPVRFMRVNVANDLPQELLAANARRLAKYGVNLSRTVFGGEWGMRLMTDDPEQFARVRDRLHAAIAASRDAGIYSWVRLYWGTGDTRVYFDPAWREQYLAFVDAFLNAPNPYTGLPIGQDPAVAFVTIQNENNLLFHTFEPRRWDETARAMVEARFGEWLLERYGSFDAVWQAWGPDRYPDTLGAYQEFGPDDWEAGRVRLYGVNFLTGATWAPSQRNHQRASDQLRFMVESQKAAHAEIVQAFREELGIRNLIVCGNWHTADTRILGPFEDYSYLPGDTIARNSYFDVAYDPRPERFFAVDIGDTYASRSSLLPPEAPLSFMVAHMGDMPYMTDENSWNRPNRFRAEAPFLVAAYGSLLDIDAWGFENRRPFWNTSMLVWEVNSPSKLGQFPAAVLAYRRGDVAQADTAVTEVLSLEDLYAFKGCQLYGQRGHDGLWAHEGDAADGQSSPGADPLAFFVGPVRRVLTEEGSSRLEGVDLARYIDRQAQRVTSLTGEVAWDYGHGVVTIDSPRAQGAGGFLAEMGRIELADIAIESDNEYGTILAVSLDGEPLARSRRILIQAGTEDKTHGFRTEPQGTGFERIVALGGHPLIVREVDAIVELKADSPITATVLDHNGYRTSRRADATEADGGILRITLPSDSLYVLLER